MVVMVDRIIIVIVTEDELIIEVEQKVTSKIVWIFVGLFFGA